MKPLRLRSISQFDLAVTGFLMLSLLVAKATRGEDGHIPTNKNVAHVEFIDTES